MAKLAEELQSTRQLLARLSLLAPSEMRPSTLTASSWHTWRAGRKISNASLPGSARVFASQRDAENLSVAELMRHLPPRTAIVDIVQRAGSGRLRAKT